MNLFYILVVIIAGLNLFNAFVKYFEEKFTKKHNDPDKKVGCYPEIKLGAALLLFASSFFLQSLIQQGKKESDEDFESLTESVDVIKKDLRFQLDSLANFKLELDSTIILLSTILGTTNEAVTENRRLVSNMKSINKLLDRGNELAEATIKENAPDLYVETNSFSWDFKDSSNVIFGFLIKNLGNRKAENVEFKYEFLFFDSLSNLQVIERNNNPNFTIFPTNSNQPYKFHSSSNKLFDDFYFCKIGLLQIQFKYFDPITEKKDKLKQPKLNYIFRSNQKSFINASKDEVDKLLEIKQLLNRYKKAKK